MTRTQIATMLKSTQLPVAYRSYPIGDAPELPYLVYYYDSDNDMIADNVNYVPIDSLTIELYTENKDFATESILEETLKQNQIVYSRSEAYITSEQMYQITYESEVIINAE